MNRKRAVIVGQCEDFFLRMILLQDRERRLIRWRTSSQADSASFKLRLPQNMRLYVCLIEEMMEIIAKIVVADLF